MNSVVSIDYVHSLCYFIAAKQQAAFPSPNEFNAYAQLANVDLFNYYNDERNKMLIQVKEGQSLYVPPVLSNFIQYDVILSQTGNVLDQPDDYLYDLEMTSASGTVLFKKVDYNKVSNYLTSTIDQPTAQYPIFVELQDSFVIYPTINNNSLTYLSNPVTVFWNYTLVNNRPVYNPIGSIDFQFDSTEVFRLTMRILGYMGLSIRDSELLQAAQEMKNTAS